MGVLKSFSYRSSISHCCLLALGSLYMDCFPCQLVNLHFFSHRSSAFPLFQVTRFTAHSPIYHWCLVNTCTVLVCIVKRAPFFVCVHVTCVCVFNKKLYLVDLHVNRLTQSNIDVEKYRICQVLMESLLWELRGSIFSKHCISDKEPRSY